MPKEIFCHNCGKSLGDISVSIGGYVLTPGSSIYFCTDPECQKSARAAIGKEGRAALDLIRGGGKDNP